MQLLRLTEVPLSDRDTVFSHSRRRAVIFLFLYVLTGMMVITLTNAKDSALGYYFAGVLVIFLFIFQKTITARFLPSNWLLRLTDDGLFIKFRSYLNCHFPAENYTVAFIPYSEIRSALRVDEVRVVPDRDDSNRPTTSTRKVRWLEVEVAADTRQLAIALASERDTVLAKTRIGDEKPSTRYHHFPVIMPTASMIRLEWSVVPSIEKALELLTRHTLVQPNEKTEIDFVNLDTLSRAEQESRLLQLAEAGDKTGAIAMARRLYGYDLTQATEFVEALARKMP